MAWSRAIARRRAPCFGSRKWIAPAPIANQAIEPTQRVGPRTIFNFTGETSALAGNSRWIRRCNHRAVRHAPALGVFSSNSLGRSRLMGHFLPWRESHVRGELDRSTDDSLNGSLIVLDQERTVLRDAPGDPGRILHS